MNPEAMAESVAVTVSLAPVYVIVLISLFFAIVFGLIFKDMLEYQLECWKADAAAEYVTFKTAQIKIAYFMTCVFTTICMGSSLSTFSFPPIFTYPVSAIIVFATGFLMWVQLGSMLTLMAQQGTAALEIE